MKINENKKKTKYDACLCFSIIEFCVHVRDKKKIEKSETERERERAKLHVFRILTIFEVVF